MPDKKEMLLYIRLGKVPTQPTGTSLPDVQYFVQVNTPATYNTTSNKTFPFVLPADTDKILQKTFEAIEIAVHSNDSDDRGYDSNALNCIKDLGNKLYDALRGEGDLRVLFHRVMEDADGEGMGLLVLLQIEEPAADLGKYLWEALSYTNSVGDSRFFFDRGQTCIARYVPAGAYWLGDPTPLKRPPKMLVVGSSFHPNGQRDRDLERFIKIERESLIPVLDELKQSKLLEWYRVVDNPSLSVLADEMKNEINILHYMGHGGVDVHAGGEFLMLRDPSNSESGKRVSRNELMAQIFRPVTMKSLRLVVLNVCSLEEQARLATRLVSLGVRAVVAMRASIGTEVITQKRGFSETFYRNLGQGQAVHIAFASARDSIALQQSMAEAFVPTLVLGSLKELVLINPRFEGAKKLRQQDDQRQQVEKILHSVKEALAKKDFDQLEIFLVEANSLCNEPELVRGLEEIVFRLGQDIDQACRESRWMEARRGSQAMQKIVKRLPDERQASFPMIDVEKRVRQVLPGLVQEIQDLHAKERWAMVVSKASEYLQLDSGNEQVRTLFEDANLAQQIKVEPDKSASNTMSISPDAEFLAWLNAQDWQPANTEQLIRQLSQFGSASHDSHNLFLEPIYDAVLTFQQNEDWSQAEDLCQQLLILADEWHDPDWQKKGQQIAGEVYLAHLREAKAQYDFEAVQNLSQKALSNPRLRPIYTDIQQLKRESEEDRRLYNAIKLL